ncbi:diacylglycerol kinase family protein [Oceanobacillus polygoni]|uniref:Diacylglycerol kinase n=1 Tax=Oceanobacillus polygoni TaxID=1235259 RepID=A0A9X1CCL2_9BACI|nr:diacylglycerol kinase family protein [Oceanobacillus polygoni]MBP2078161.1 diacylglycerol kinase [Oceanobacillus polygoni]
MKDKKRKIGFSYAWNGIKEIAKTERNFRIHLLATFLTVAAGFLFKLTMVEWAIIVLTIGLVLMVEVTNTAIEKLIDYLRPEIHPTAKIIKDVAAGAVLIAAIIAAIIGLLIFLPKLHILF